MKYQVLFSLKNNEDIFMNVVCCSCDWHFKGQSIKHAFYKEYSSIFDSTMLIVQAHLNLH